MLKEKNLRTRRLFRNNGRSLVIAMDHARVFDTVTSLKNIAEVVKAVRAGGADAILTPWLNGCGCRSLGRWWLLAECGCDSPEYPKHSGNGTASWSRWDQGGDLSLV